MMPVNWLTIRKFSEQTGYSEDAVRGKIRDGVWLEGRVWIKAPDNRVLLSVEGYNQWVESSLAFKQSANRVSKSPSPIAESVAARELGGSPPPLT